MSAIGSRSGTPRHPTSRASLGRARGQAVALLVCAALAFAAAEFWRPRQHLAEMRPRADLEQLFPKTFGDWVEDDRQPVQLVSPDVQALLDTLYSQVLSRVYVHRTSGRRVMLSVAYGGDQSDAGRAHRPEVCYPAQGFDISGRRMATWQFDGSALQVGQLVARLGPRQEPVSYWFVVGEHIAVSGTQQKLVQLRYGMRGIVPDGMLVRVSSVDADVGQAYRVHEEFVRGMLAPMSPAQRVRVAGGGA